MKDAAGPPSNNYFQTYVYGTEYRGSSIESVSHQEGRLFRTSGSSSNPVWRYEYSISDHLGNTRLTFADKTPDGVIKIEDGEVLEEAHYYPFGLAMEGPWINDAAALDTRYKFNGIERVQDFGLNMDLAMYRSYDPAIGRWWQADPIVKPWENPYAAMYNNPMNWSDFLGADPEEDGDSDSSDQGRRRKKPKKGKDLPEVVVTAKRVENNSPITNLQIHTEGVYFQKGESWYKVTEAPLAEGGGQLYGYDARAGWVRVSSSYQDYKSQLEAATTLADGMTTAVAIVEGFFGAGVMFNAGLLAPAKAGLRTVPATGRFAAQGARMGNKAPISIIQLGRWGESRLAQVLGNAGTKPSGPFTTNLGNRYVDRLVNGIAHEAKAGYNVKLTSSIRTQILKDVELIKSGQIRGAQWHFFNGADNSVLNFLRSKGIPYTIH